MNKDSVGQHNQHTHKISLFIKKNQTKIKYFNCHDLSTCNFLDCVKHCFTYIQDISIKLNKCFPQKNNKKY